MTQDSVVVIDGPNASGKGTLARNLSEWLGFPLLDTGLLYRAAGLAALKKGVNLDDEAAAARIIQDLSFEIRPPNLLLVNRVPADLTALRKHETGDAASRVGAHKQVRDHLRSVQQEFAARGRVILDGRDIGTRIYPEAEYKFYLTASPESRAKRRVAQLAAQGIRADYDAILKDVNLRDDRDQTRAHDPLRPADDAIVIDTSELTPDEVLARVKAHLTDGSGAAPLRPAE